MVQRHIQHQFHLSRRQFLGSAAVAGFACITSGSSAAQTRNYAGLDQMVTGHIGTGRRGQELLRHLRPYARALCDVDRSHLQEGLAIAAPGTEAFGDYRALLELPDITAVVIATPHHWHGQIALDACMAGKDVYVEGPAAFYLGDCARLARAAEQQGVIVAVGASSLLSSPASVAPPDSAEVRLSGPGNPRGGNPLTAGAPPATLDWPQWLGPSPWRPYNPDYGHDTWRWMLAFGGGQIMTHGVQAFQRVLNGLADTPARVRVTASGSSSPDNLWDCPESLQVRYQLEPSGEEFVWEQEAGAAPPVYAGDDSDAEPAMRQWTECLRDRMQPLVSLQTACHAAEWAILGNLAYQLGRTLVWDTHSRSFVDDSQANRLIASPVSRTAQT